jgi:CRP-like cAMP-binding protein
MKSSVVVVGRRTGKPQQSRRWVYFNVDWRFQPSDVISTIDAALIHSKAKHVSHDPQPHCVLVEMGDSFGRYAVRYWLGDVASDTATDSEVRTQIYFALQRAGIRLSMPATAVFVTQESADRTATKTQQQVTRRAAVLSRLDLFDSLSDDERSELARGMRYTPFAPGEVMTRQGAEAHWLYILEEGRVVVRVSDKGIEKEVATIDGPAFFGEMSLMTGEPRSATVVAVTDAECFRLDKATFQQVLQARPELAESMAAVLTRRRAELLAVREGLDAEASMRRLAGSEKDLLDRIRGFFGLMN